MTRRSINLLLLVAAFTLFPTCKAKDESPKVEAPKPDGTYTARGRIESLPKPAPAPEFLEIHHEPVPAFTNSSGKVVGMPEMVMPFPEIAPGIDTGAFKIGDNIEFTFQVYWKPRTRYVVTSLKK